MAQSLVRRWTSSQEIAAYLPKSARRTYTYAAYLPDPIASRSFRFSAELTAALVEAEQAVRYADRQQAAPGDVEALARLLLRAESVGSSRIEGLVINARRLFRADLQRKEGEVVNDLTAREVLANIDAMTHAVESISSGTRITTDLLLEMHEKLLRESRMHEHAGRFRNEQNWIGGSSYNPCAAAYVPPPPEYVDMLMDDLCAFSRETLLPPLAQAALAHAQFETIHPFADGNGRIGRALIHLILRYRGITPNISLPVSLILARSSERYVAGLTAYRYTGSPKGEEATDRINRWVSQFVEACLTAAHEAHRFMNEIDALERNWRTRIPKIRKGSTQDLLLGKIAGCPVLDVRTAAELTNRSLQAANEAIESLVTHGIVTPIGRALRGRTYEAVEVIRLFTAFERRVASPALDTQLAPPARNVPKR